MISDSIFLFSPPMRSIALFIASKSTMLRIGDENKKTSVTALAFFGRVTV